VYVIDEMQKLLVNKHYIVEIIKCIVYNTVVMFSKLYIIDDLLGREWLTDCVWMIHDNEMHFL